jgi:hypothetical protein
MHMATWRIWISVARWRFSKPNLGNLAFLEVVWHLNLNFLLAFFFVFGVLSGFFSSCLAFFKKMAFLCFLAHLIRK